MRKVEKEMWRHILAKTSASLAKGNLEVLPMDDKIQINCYQCGLAMIEPLNGNLKVTFTGDCWDGVTATVMGRVRALSAGHKVKFSENVLTFMRHDIRIKVGTSNIAEQGFSILVDPRVLREAISS